MKHNFIIQKLFNLKPKQLELLTVDMAEKSQKLDFEVVSRSYYDTHGNEFISFEEFNDFWAIKSILASIPADKFEEYLTNLGVKCYVYDDLFSGETAYRYGGFVHTETAKMCNFGTIKFLRGEFQNQKFMYPIVDFDLDLQLFAYAVLAYGFIDVRMVKHLNDEENHKYCKMVLGAETFKLVLQKINETKKKKF